METKMYLCRLNLQLFAEGATGGSEGAAGGVSGVMGAVAGPQSGVKGNSSAQATAEGSTQATAAQGQTADPGKAVDLDAEFEELIKGKYKDQFGKKTKGIVQERLKGTKASVERLEALTPLLDLIAQKYGVDPADAKALYEAAQADDSNFEKEALEKGMSVEHLRALKKVEGERDALKRKVELTNREEYQARRYQKWMEQETETKKIHPNFSLETELQNPQFKSLLNNNIDVRTAYEICHHDEIMTAAMDFAAKKAQEQYANNIIANGARPSENGVSAQASAATGVDVSKLSRAEFLEYQRRVSRGEKIDFTNR